MARIVIEFDYSPGHPGRMGGGPDTWEPPEPAEIEIVSVEINGKEIQEIREELDLEECRVGDLVSMIYDDQTFEEWVEDYPGEVDP